MDFSYTSSSFSVDVYPCRFCHSVVSSVCAVLSWLCVLLWTVCPHSTVFFVLILFFASSRSLDSGWIRFISFFIVARSELIFRYSMSFSKRAFTRWMFCFLIVLSESILFFARSITVRLCLFSTYQLWKSLCFFLSFFVSHCFFFCRFCRSLDTILSVKKVHTFCSLYIYGKARNPKIAHR